MVEDQELRLSQIHSNAEKIIIARRRLKAVATKEKQGNYQDAWYFYNSGADNYELAFYPVFSMSFEKFLSRRTESGKSRFVLDLMGQGQVLRELPIQGGLAVSLADGRNAEQREQDAQKNIQMVGGDVMSKKTWEELKRKMATLSTDSFDLILCRPVGGLQSIAEIQNLYYQFINNLWNLTSSNDGLILTEIPYYARCGGYFYKWLREVENAGIGYAYSYSDIALKLVKRPDSPTDLPKLKYVRN